MAALQLNNFNCFSEYFKSTLSELQMNFPHDRTPVATFWCDKVTQKIQNRRQSTITLHQTFSLSPTVQQAELLLSAKLPCAMNFSSSSLCLHWTWTKKREANLARWERIENRKIQKGSADNSTRRSPSENWFRIFRERLARSYIEFNLLIITCLW